LKFIKFKYNLYGDTVGWKLQIENPTSTQTYFRTPVDFIFSYSKIFPGFINTHVRKKKSYKIISSEDHQAKRRKEEKPKPQGQEGMPQHQHCPPAKRRGDRNLNYHEGQQKDVA
jgi:hypothetical protein